MKTRIVYYENTGCGTGSSQSLKAILALIDRDRFEPVLWFGDMGNLAYWSNEQVVESRVGWLSNCDYFPAGLNSKWLKHFLGFMLKTIRDLYQVPRMLRRLKPDVLHINSGQGLIVGLVAKRLGIPVVWQIRELVCQNWLGRIQDGIYASACCRIIAISTAVRIRLPRSDATGKMSTMYNAVGPLLRPSDHALVGFREKLWIPDGALIVLLLGHVCLAKGYAFLAEVADLLVEHAVFFVLAGDASGDMKKEVESIRSRWRKHESAGRAVFCGRVDQSLAISAADVVVCPNQLDEPLGRTVLEAYRFGVPVMAMDRPAFDETIRDGQTGWLLPPSAEAWAGKLKDLERNRELFQFFKKNTLEFGNQFDDQEYVRSLHSIYEKASQLQSGCDYGCSKDSL